MKKMYLLVVAAFLFISVTAEAAKITYIATNHRFNSVKLKEVSKSVADVRNMTHPVQVDEVGLRAALASINLSRSFIIKKEVDTQQVFNDAAIDFLAINLAKAFSQAKSNEEVLFSYLSKHPYFIIRNDRINLGSAWISGNELHMRFDKLYAKVTLDTDKRGNEGEAISKARGLRVKLELGPGQKMGVEDSDEVVLDMNYNYADNLKKPEPTTPPVEKTMSGETVQQPASEAAGAPVETLKDKKLTKKEKANIEANAKAKLAEQSAESAVVAPAPTVKERLQALDQLKKDGLVNKSEYDAKRKEILKDL